MFYGSLKGVGFSSYSGMTHPRGPLIPWALGILIKLLKRNAGEKFGRGFPGLEFVPCSVPSSEEVGKLLKSLSKRILRWLVRQGYYEREGQEFPSEEDGVLASCQAASIQYRIALGARAGQRVRRLGAMASCFDEEAEFTSPRCASLGGFSLHADTACEAWEGEKLERLCCYVARPALAIGRLTRRPDGMLVYKLKQAYRDGTRYLLFSPEELMEKLAALVPQPRVHLIRYHGCLAPNAKIRAEVVRQARGPDGVVEAKKTKEVRGSRRRMNWSALLKRVFKVDVESCQGCRRMFRRSILRGPRLRGSLNSDIW